ncbi:uncharacterized protein LOC117306802 [Asterias rubens]|uniref:uncharacterized protein LOC117306802 n=1 Tax=Asterias rubens TaxID=7604 RepID=UPI001454F48F|nr:uncharacterized protein LOC117306802 [Asterias rubens]
MSNQEDDEWVPHRRKGPQKGAPLLSLESSAISDDGSILGGRSSSDVYQSGRQRTNILSETFLQRVTKNIHVKDWKPIFRDLVSPFINNVEVLIGEIEKDNQNDSREQKYQALVKWKGIMPGDDEAKYQALEAILKTHHCWKDSDQEVESVNTGGATKKKPKQKDTGARPKVRPKVKHGVDNEGILTIELEGSTEPLLQVKLKDVLEIDEVVVADVLLISVITPSFANINVQMKLTELEERFYDKYGTKGLQFENIGIGTIEMYVRDRSRCTKLITMDKENFIQVVNDDKSKLRVLSLVGDNYESDNLGKYGKPSEQSLHTTELCEWHPARSKISTKQIVHKSVSETPTTDKLYCQMPDAKQFAKLIAKSGDTSVKFRTEKEYSGESGSITFTKDVVAWWNTPRNGDVFLIIGVKGYSSPPHDLIGLQNRRINADYQAMFKRCFSHTPTFVYSEVEYSDKVFGVVGIPNSKGSGKVCWATETKGDEWTQNNILFCDGGTIMPANQKQQDQIYKWFHSTPDKTSSHRSSRKGEDEAWEEFLQKLDLENQPRRSYCLLVSKCSNETRNLQALAKFSWLQVWDFDPDSRESGFLAVCEADLQERLAVRTWNDAPQDSLSESFLEWLFVRGLTKREDSLVPSSVREWVLRVGKHLDNYCDLLSTHCEGKPLTIVVVWYGSKDILRHLKRTLLKLDEHITSGITYIICMQQTPADDYGRNLMTELCDELEITKVIEISLDRLCFGMLSIVDDQPHADIVRHLPGSVGSISNRDSRWLHEELEVLYKSDELLKQENVTPGEVFLRGGTLIWQEMHIGIFDAKRNLLKELAAFLQCRLHRGSSCIVTLYHEPGAGGTTLSRRILWDFHDQFPCVCTLADVLDPSKIFQRLESLYCQTKTPILLVVDGQESRLLQELFEMSQGKIHIVILNVQRYTKAIGNQTHAKDKFWLKGEVDSCEAQRFNAVFSQITKGKVKLQLQKLVREVDEKTQKHFVYEFGLAAYNENYKGLRPYVRGFLALQRNEALNDWQTAVGYLALAFFYGHKCIPCQFFSLLFDKKDTEIVSACDVLTHSGNQFVLEDTRKCTWRITHHAVAKEILEQILTQGSPSNGEGNDLSNQARRNLREFAKDFLTYASKRLKYSKPDPSSYFMRTLRAIFIHRDYKEVGQDQYKRELLSRLMCDIQDTSGQKKLDLMEHLVECFPTDPTFVSHLGRACNIYTHDFEKSLAHLTKAKELRQLEIKACAEKYSDTKNQGQSMQDAILCTIYHNLGNVHHDKIKSLIGGGKLKDRKHYIGKPDQQDSFREVCKYASSAIHNFSTCRQHLTKGMDESYGYIGEIKVRLHIADYVATRYEQGGYYGFLTSENNSAEAKELVESCFSKVNVLLRQYQDLMKTTRQPETDELDSCLNWFSAIFDDPGTALKYWKGREDVDSCRDMIAIYTLKHKGKRSARTTTHILNNITSGDDVEKIVELYEKIFKDAYRRSISIDVSAEVSDWIVAIRNPSLQSTVYSMSDKVLPQVKHCHNLTPQSIMTLYYLYVVNTTLALLTQKKMYLSESKSLLGKMEEKKTTVNRIQRKFAWEWLKTNKEKSIHCLVHRSCLGSWNSEKRFWQDESAHAKLQVCTGVIKSCEMPFHGQIAITTGGLHQAVTTSSLIAVYVPKHYGLFGKNYLNREVEFFIGFNIEHGIEAFNVCELKKGHCDHCKITVTVSRLEQRVRKLCHKCHRLLEIYST